MNLVYFLDSYSTENVIFEWNDLPYIIPDDLRLPQFSLGDMLFEKCDKQYVGGKWTLILNVLTQISLEPHSNWHSSDPDQTPHAQALLCLQIV